MSTWYSARAKSTRSKIRSMGTRQAGVLRSSARGLTRVLERADLRVSHRWTTGMISQNNTPTCLVPMLRIFDRFDFALAEYHVLIGRKPAEGAPP